MKKILLIFIPVLLVGCMATSQYTTTFDIPKGRGDAAWSRAQAHVALNSDFRIQVVSDYVIDTYYVPDYDFYNYVGYTVTREERGSNYFITIMMRSYTTIWHKEFKSDLMMNDAGRLKKHMMEE